MLQAHLRGLLKPDYANGVSSVLREEMVLQAISQETEGHSLMVNAQMQSSMMNCIAPADRARSLRNAMDNLRMGTSLLRMEPYAKILRKVKAHSVEANAAAFNLLQRTDIFEKLADILKAERKSIPERNRR